MRWRRSARDGDGGVFLDGTDSALTDFGESGGDSFAQAWHAEPPPLPGEPEPFLDSFDDKKSRRARDLDRRSFRVPLLLGAVVLIGVALAVAVDRGVLSDPTGLAPQVEETVNEIVSIGDDRSYVPADGPQTVGAGVRGDQRFAVAQGATNPERAGDAHAGDTLVFERVLWGGRAHVAVLGSAITTADDDVDSGLCSVVSLVATDLRVVDLASDGRCQPGYDATGDRLACRGEGILLLEVWPFDPDAVVEQPDVTGIRVRFETAGAAVGTIDSIRGATTLDEDFLESIPVISGAPGEDVTLSIGGQTASCTLLDRAEVAIQLL